MINLRTRLASGEVVLIDGATGTELEKYDVPMNEFAWCGLASLTHPAAVQQVHEENIRAGAQVIIANTFVCSRHILERAGHAEHFELLNRVGVELAIAARDATAADVVVAGSVSTSQQGAEFPAIEAARKNYRDQVQIQIDAGVEMFVLEMMRDLDHTEAALDAVLGSGLPVWLGWSATLIDGVPYLWNKGARLEEGMELIKDRVEGIELISIMHTEVDHVDACLDVVEAHWDGPIGVYAQTGEYIRPHWVFTDTITPDDYTKACLRWVARGVQVIGGCCGIRPAHIEHLRNRLPHKITRATR